VFSLRVNSQILPESSRESNCIKSKGYIAVELPTAIVFLATALKQTLTWIMFENIFFLRAQL